MTKINSFQEEILEIFGLETNLNLNKNFSLVLSGGSALGLGHLGVIRYLEENNLKAKEIIGTSMGAILGAIYASGLKYDDIIKIFKKINYLKLLQINIIPKDSLININNIRKFLEEILQNKDFKDLDIDLKVIATNVENGSARVFDKNSNVSLIDALCASFSIPGIFEAYKIEDKYYSDGFLSSNLPIEFASHKRILAIDVIKKKLLEKTNFNKMNLAIEKSFLILILNQTKEKLKNNKKIAYVSLDLSDFKIYEFYKWDKIIDKAYLDFSNTINKCYIRKYDSKNKLL